MAGENLATVAPSGVRRFEPSVALYDGKAGLDFYKRILNGLGDYLKPGGFLVLELGYGQLSGVQELFEATGQFDTINIIKDLRGIERVISARYNHR